MKKLLLSATLVLLGLTVVPGPRSTQAQLLLVTGDYRITEMDENNQRFGVALPEAKPDVTQNWCYVEPKTDIHRRITKSDGWSKEDSLNYYQFFQNAKPGTMVRIHGGRRWDGGITSKTLWLGYPEQSR
ncbi:hypothetical protein IV102_28370 [bacterium]|nr:hypothetical protein [bacterium]